MKKRFLTGFLSAALCGCLLLPSFAMVAAAVLGAAGKQEQQADSTDVSSGTGRETQNFNKDWRFCLGNVKGAEEKAFDDSAWRRLNLPHDYSIEQDFDLASPAKAGGGFLNGGIAWYRKNWVVPKEMAGKRIRIEFEGIYMDSSVYVNGTLVGNYPYSYSAINYDITDYLVADGMTENVIAVRVNNEQPSSRWYSGSGIYRNVKLIATEAVHVDRYGTKVTTPDLEQEYSAQKPVTVKVDTDVVNESAADISVTLRHIAYYNGSLEEPGSLDPAGSATTEQAVLKAGETKTIASALSVADPHLWEVGKGGMYMLHTEVLQNGQVIDTFDTDFGLRWLKFDPENGFFVNGTYTKMQGVCQHHDQGALGAVNNPAALDRQIRILREMGVNSIRSSHNPASRALLDACNEQGIMVMNEGFDCWWGSKNLYDFHRFYDTPCTHPDAKEGQTWQEYDLKNMVSGSKNDPAVVMWSIGNEIGESWSEKAVEEGGKLRSWVKEVDDTRAVTQADPIFYNLNWEAYDPANNQAHWRLINGHDAMGFNYGQYTDYDYVHEKNPDWFIYSSETSSAVATRGEYFHPDVDLDHDAGLHRSEYKCSEFDNDCVNWGTTVHYALREDAKRKYMGGLFFWTGFDYIGEPAPFAGGSSKSSYFGAVDTCGFPKETFYLIQSQWLDEKTDPMVHILPHWNWEDDHSIEIDGKMPIRIYSNARSVEVFLNGESLGKKEFAYYPETETSLARQDDGSEQENLYLQWLVPYEKGTVEAVAYDENGNEIARDIRTTAGDPAAIRIMPEREVITADGEDLCYVEVDIVDENGVMNPHADNDIRFSVSGNGRIVGTDNGDPTDFTNMKSSRRSAFNGKALVIVQSTQKAGSFTITASAAGLRVSRATVYTVKDGGQDALLGYRDVSLNTRAGQQPALPEKVTAVYQSGKHEEAEVEWEKIEDSQLAKAGVVTVTGTVKRDQAKVKAFVEVVAPVGVQPVSAVTSPGVMPALPAQAELRYSDGTKEAKNVTWDAIDENDLTDGAQLTVEGALEDSADWKAHAYVRVSAGGEEKNVARAVRGSEYPRFEASYTSTYDPLEHVNDGIISYDTNPKNGWGNWKYAPIPEVTTLDCELEEELVLNNIWIYFREDGGIYIPKDTLIQYWDGENWRDVENQSARNGFVSGKEQIITFDPVKTKKLRAQFTRGEQDTSGGKKDCLVLTEVEIYAVPPDRGRDTAKLESLTVGGEPMADFDPDQASYTISLPYGAEVPQIEASAADHGTVFVLPAVTNQSAALIRVTSENGKVTKDYTVQFEEAEPAVVSAQVKLGQETVTEDDLVRLHVDALLESGELADEDSLDIRYVIKDAGTPAKAEVKNGILYAYWAGDIEIYAEVSYRGGQTFAGEPLTVSIASAQGKKEIVSYAQVTVDTKKDQVPVLPETVRATFDSGLPKDVLVAWDAIPAGACGVYGTFTVNGTVEGSSLKPTATVRVRDMLAGQNVSMATPVGVEPKLPDDTAVYYTDGASVRSSVSWQDYDHEQLKKEGIFEVKGVTELGGYEVSASVRVTNDTVQSENHAKNRNGCPYSKAIVSYSEGNSAVALNDGLLNKWTDWSNPNKKGEVWFGVIFGADYPELRYVDTVVLDLLNDSEWNRTKIETCTVEYYNKPITLEDVPASVANFDDASMAAHPFNNPENWTEVTNLKQPEQYGYGDNKLTFDMIEVPAIRVKVNHGTPGGTYYMALREFYAYGKLAASNSDFKVTGITADGKALEGFEEGKYSYSVRTSGDKMPELSLSADQNASVTLIPSADATGEAKFVVVSEDGLKTETYTIRLVDSITGELEELKKELEETKKELRLKEEALAAALKDVETAQNEKEAAQNELANAKEALKDANQKLQDALKEAADAKEDAEQKIAAAQKEVSDAQQNASEALDRALEAEEKLTEALNEKAAIEQELADAQNQIAALQNQIASLQQELADALKELADAAEAQKKAEAEAAEAKQKAEQEAKAAKEAQEARLKAEQEAKAAEKALKKAQQELEVARKALQTASGKTQIQFSKKKYTVKKGKTVRLGVTVKNKNGSKITYKSANKKIAKVSKKGVVKGIKKGKTKITVTCNKVKKSVTVQVK